MVIIDDFSRMTWIFLLKSKVDTFSKFEELYNEVENQSSRKVKTLRSDNGKEFVNLQFNNLCKKKGIKRQILHLTLLSKTEL